MVPRTPRSRSQTAARRLIVREVHDQHVAVGVVGNGVADAGTEQTVHHPVLVSDDDHLSVPFVGELNDRVRRLADRTLIISLDALPLEVCACGFEFLGVLLGRVGRVDLPSGRRSSSPVSRS